MKSNDKKNLVIFSILIVLLVVLIIYNFIINNKIENINRKIKYIFNDYTYDEVYNRSSVLFNNAIKLLNNNFEYQKDKNGKDQYFSIQNYNKYRRIIDFDLITSSLSYEEINNYLDKHQIIIDNNKYYIKFYNSNLPGTYVGSLININSYDGSYVYFNSQNFYCDNYEYIGIIEEVPNCKYETTNTTFTLVLEDDILKLANLNEFESILK